MGNSKGKVTFELFLLKWYPNYENLFKLIIRHFGGSKIKNLLRAYVLTKLFGSISLFFYSYFFHIYLLNTIHRDTDYFCLSFFQFWKCSSSSPQEFIH